MKYKIIKLIHSDFDYLVIALSNDNPDKYIVDVLKEISTDTNKKYVRIVIDLLLMNGLSPKRYLLYNVNMVYPNPYQNQQGYFLKNTKHIPKNIQRITSEYLCQHKDYVNKSRIPKALKYMILMDMIK